MPVTAQCVTHDHPVNAHCLAEYTDIPVRHSERMEKEGQEVSRAEELCSRGSGRGRGG